MNKDKMIKFWIPERTPDYIFILFEREITSRSIINFQLFQSIIE